MGSITTLVQRKFGPLVSVARLPKPVPFVKWAGGKGQLIKQMDHYFPLHYNTYFEPFLGGGAVFFHLLPPKAILSDSNPELVNAWQVVRDEPADLMASLDDHRTHRKDREYFYKVRRMDPRTMDRVKRAARTIFLNKTCYNGLYRVNSEGLFNVPWGNYSNPTLYDRENILAASAALQDKGIRLGDYRDILKVATKGDFVDIDPPYQPLSPTSGFTGYTRDAFNRTDQEHLAEWFRRLDRRGCKLMLFNSATPFVRSLYKGHRIKVVKAKRAINSKGQRRGAIDELLIMNY